jgi:predicted PurR-regulated permease PerM
MAATQEQQPGSLSPYARRVWLAVGILATVVALGALFSWLLTGVLVVFAAALFGIFLNQLSRWIEGKCGIGYHWALGLVSVGLLAAAGALIYVLGAQIASQAAEFTDQLTAAGQETWTRVKQGQLGRWVSGDNAPDVTEMLPDKSAVVSTASSAVMTVVSALGGVVFVVVVGFYLALQPETYREGLVRLFPPASRQRVAEVLQQVVESLWAWTLGRIAAMFVIGIASTIGLWALGVPLPITNGVISGVLNFVPNLGPVMAAIPAMLLGMQVGGYTPLYIAGFYFGLQFIEANFLTPLIDQQQVSLPPGLLISAQLLFGLVGGFLGLLLATPIAAALFILVREFYVKDSLEQGANGG